MDEKRYIKRKEKAYSDGNKEQLAICCNQLGAIYNQQGRYDAALKEYKQEAEVYVNLGKDLETAKAKRMAGEMCILLSMFDEGKIYINDYLKIAKRLQNQVEEQRAYATLGRAHLLHGQNLAESSATAARDQLKQAEKSFLRSLLLIKEISGQISKLEQLDMQARCYLNIGVVKEHMHEYETSIEYLDKAIRISKTHDLFELTHLCYVSMSLLYSCKKSDATLALRYCNLALEVAKRLPNKVKKICETLIIKSEILIKAGDFASVKHILTKAYKKNSPDENDRAAIEKSLRIVIKICQTLDDLVLANSVDYAKLKELYEKLGDGCCHLLNFEKALEYYQKMLECAQLNHEEGKSLIPIYISLYQTYKDNKQYDKALEYLWKEFEENQDVAEEAFTTLCSIAEICELQSQPFWTVHDIYQRAIRLGGKAGDAALRLQKIAMVRLKKLLQKNKMEILIENLETEAKEKGIKIEDVEDNDSESGDELPIQQNTPDWGDDVCLDDLTDPDASDLDETEKPRPQRTTRGARTLTIKRNNKGETQLHQACIMGNLELARRLIEQGHTVNVRDHAGWLPLHEACNHGYRDIVELLLDKGGISAINDKGGTSCDGITPLYDACANGYLDIAELLIMRGADVTVRTDYGETCIEALDKWRLTSQLIDCEQAQYAQVRELLLNTLSKVGICSAKNIRPLTNSEAKIHRKSDDKEEHDDDNEYENLDYKKKRSSYDGNSSINRQSSASKQYRSVMAQLKRPNRTPSTFDDQYDDVPSSSSSSNISKRKAFLNEDEVDADDWLIDDIRPENKKKRYNCTNIPNNNYEATEFCNDDLLGGPNVNDVLFKASSSSSTSKQRQKQVKKLSLSRSSSMSGGSSGKSKMQASLLDSGFCRFQSASPLHSSEESSQDGCSSRISLNLAEPDSTTTAIQLVISPGKKSSPIKIQTTPVMATTVSFKIKVQDELLLVPIEQKKLHDINMRWLAEEASRRYYKLTGLTPILRLKTIDGFAYEESDAVSVALEQNMILGTIMEWKIIPMTQRYEEMCHQEQSVPREEVKLFLERCEGTQSMELVGLWLRPKQTSAIFKALLHQARLTQLDLSYNFIQNEGCTQLAKALPTLLQLKVLRLQGNGISHIGLEALLCCPDIQKLEHLEEVILSKNPLGNSSMQVLGKFCSSTTTGPTSPLRVLQIAQCDITELYDFDLCYSQLTGFDISFNQLSSESQRKLMQSLNICRLQHLNLSFISWPLDNQASFKLGERLVALFESGTCEKLRNLALSGCGLNDVNFYKIVENLRKSKDLQTLDISDNVGLTGASLGYIMDALPHVEKLVAINCLRLIDDLRLEKLQEQRQLPKYMELTLDEQALRSSEAILQTVWESHWGEKAKIVAHKGMLKLFIDGHNPH